jgi:serine/threonine-protein kinase
MAELPSPEVTQSDALRSTVGPTADQKIFVSFDSDSSQIKTWGNFQLLQRLGRGAFGEVYRAWDPVLEREVALKLLLPKGLDPEQEFASIVAEARAIARIRHPNIVSVYGVDRREGRVGFWSDFVRGQTLSALVAAQGPLDEKSVAKIGIALCEALAAVHNAGLLHRDIKASNAMRDENGRVLLMDFGLSQDLLGSSGIGGTPAYLAPEVLSGQPASVQSDLYALGILLRFLAMGELQRTGNEGRAAANSTPVLSAGLEPIVAKATDRDPKLRYASAKQMEAALANLLELAAVPAAQHADVPRSRGRSMERRIAGGALALAIIGATAFQRYFSKERHDTPTGGTPAYQDYLAAEDALLRYDKPGNTDKAIDLYQRVLQKSQNDALAEAGLARAYWRKYFDTSDKHWSDEADQASAKAMELNPNLAAVQMTVGMIHVDEGKASVGEQELQRAEQLDRRSADVHAALAEADRVLERPNDAKSEFETAKDLDPDNWRWPYLLGAMQIDGGDLTSAEESLKTALSKTPDNARVLYNLGLVYRKEDRLPEAQAALEKSIALDPRSDPMMALGNVLMMRGELQQRLELYLRASKIDPDDYNVWGNVAAAYLESGQHDQAVSAYKKAIALALDAVKKTPNDAYVVSVLGKYYAYLHDEAHARPLMRKALVLAPTDPDVLERVGESYEALGDRRDALELIKKALNMGFSVSYAKADPTLRALRRDPDAPLSIR